MIKGNNMLKQKVALVIDFSTSISSYGLKATLEEFYNSIIAELKLRIFVPCWMQMQTTQSFIMEIE